MFRKMPLLSLPALILATALQAQVTVQLQVLPYTMLPGIPPSFAIRVLNGSPAPVTLLNAANLEVTPPAGARFFAEAWPGHFSEVFRGEAEVLTIGANSTGDVYLPLDVTLTEPVFFMDPRLSVPGSYLFRMHLYRKMDETTNEDVPSNDVRFVIETPVGEDEAVWNRMKQLANGKWSGGESWAQYGFGLAREIFASHPTSRYLPYVARFKPSASNAEKLAALDQALAMKPAGPISDMLKLGQAGVHEFASDDALRDARIDTAISESAAAQTILEDVAKHSTFPFVRAEADGALKAVPTANELRSMLRFAIEHAPVAPLPLSPQAECVDVVGQQVIARFGYNNPNKGLKIILPGKLNRVSSGDSGQSDQSDQGQPLQFSPGSHPHVFSTIANGDTVTWFLDGGKATAGRDTTPCTPPPDALPLRPFVDCVKQAGANLFVHFGYDNPNRYALVVPPGANNTATPAPDAAPPTAFEPGIHHNAWSVKLKGVAAVTWTLQGTAVSATAGATAKCSDGGDD